MKTFEEFLIEKGILIKDAKIYPINLSRDGHLKTKEDIIKAGEEYARYFKLSSIAER